MKYIRLYEELSNEPQVGDYVVCNITKEWFFNDDSDGGEPRWNFDTINNSVGRIRNKSSFLYSIKFDFEEDIIVFNTEDIVFHSKNKKDCELYLDTKKYNL